MSALSSSITSNMLFPPPPPWAVLVLQNRQNVCFPSKGWLSWRIGSISQGTLRQPSATACSCGDRSLITQACCCFCPPSTSSAEDLTGEAWGVADSMHTEHVAWKWQRLMGLPWLSVHTARLGCNNWAVFWKFCPGINFTLSNHDSNTVSVVAIPLLCRCHGEGFGSCKSQV